MPIQLCFDKSKLNLVFTFSTLVSSIQPKLPAGVPMSGAAPVNVPFRIIVGENGSVNPAVTIRDWPLSDDRIIVPL